MAQALTLPNPRDGLASSVALLSARDRRFWPAWRWPPAIAVGGAAYSSPELPDGARLAPPAPPPLLVRQIAPEQALQVNQTIPIAAGPNPAARPFAFRGDSAARSRALECLASAVYYEAGDQDDNGQRAVAQVVLNRVRHPAFPGSVCDVVYQGSTRATGCQFTFTCDGSLYRRPDVAGWNRAYAHRFGRALAATVYAPVGYATHYHANYVVPYWASTLAKNAVVGAHIFYRWAGGWGRSGRVFQGLFGPRAQRRRAAQRGACGGGCDRRTGRQRSRRRRLPTSPAPRRFRSPRRCAATSASRSASTSTARKASEAAPHDDYVEKFKASDNLRWSLSDEAVAANEKPLGQAARRRPARAPRARPPSRSFLMESGASDGTRTRDLRRDRPAL